MPHFDNNWTRDEATRVYNRKREIAVSLDNRAAGDFLDYMNDYLTVARWAADHGMEEQRAIDWLARGKRVHNLRAAIAKAEGGAA